MPPARPLPRATPPRLLPRATTPRLSAAAPRAELPRRTSGTRMPLALHPHPPLVLLCPVASCCACRALYLPVAASLCRPATRRRAARRASLTPSPSGCGFGVPSPRAIPQECLRCSVCVYLSGRCHRRVGCRRSLGYHAVLHGGWDFPVPYLSGVDLEALPFVGSAHLIVDALRAMPRQLTNSVGLSMLPVPPF